MSTKTVNMKISRHLSCKKQGSADDLQPRRVKCLKTEEQQMLNLKKKQKAKRNDSTSNVWIDWRRTRCLNCLLKCRSALIGSSPFSDCTKERKAKVLSFDLSICGSSAHRPGRVQWSRTTDPAMFELNENMRSAFSQGKKRGSKNIWLNEGAERSSIHALHPILDADWNCSRSSADHLGCRSSRLQIICWNNVQQMICNLGVWNALRPKNNRC